MMQFVLLIIVPVLKIRWQTTLVYGVSTCNYRPDWKLFFSAARLQRFSSPYPSHELWHVCDNWQISKLNHYYMLLPYWGADMFSCEWTLQKESLNKSLLQVVVVSCVVSLEYMRIYSRTLEGILKQLATQPLIPRRTCTFNELVCCSFFLPTAISTTPA